MLYLVNTNTIWSSTSQYCVRSGDRAHWEVTLGPRMKEHAYCFGSCSVLVLGVPKFFCSGSIFVLVLEQESVREQSLEQINLR